MQQKEEVEIIKKLQQENLPQHKKEILFNRIVDKYKNKLFRVVYNYLKPNVLKEDVEEIILEVFIKFYKNIKNFKFESSVETYLYRIAINLAINFSRSKKVEVLPIEEKQQNIKEENSFVDKIILSEQKQEIKDIMLKQIVRLPTNQKVALYLAKYEQLSYKEIAEIMGVSVSSVESLLFRAKQNIKKFILKDRELAKRLGLDK
ncbi:MAG: RNA polymerase sigma factor [Endomicrobiia bacterium]